MKITICRARSFWGEVRPPSDKSLTHRAYMLSAIARDGGNVRNPLRADDCERTLQILRDLGYSVSDVGGAVGISGEARRFEGGEFYCGNSGTTMRLMAGLLCGLGVSCTLSGDESLSRRPMRRIVEPLRMMGANIEGDKAPLKIGKAKLHGIEYTTPIPSAQIKSAILLAGLFADGPTTVSESVLSRDHTERMLQSSGCAIQRDGLSVTVLPSVPRSISMNVPADISSAAYFMTSAALLGGPITIKDLGVNPTRTGILEVLRQAGANVNVGPISTEQGEPVADVRIERAGALNAFSIAGHMVPKLIDEIPVLAVLATQCSGETVIQGASELRVKESDRIESVVAGLTKMGGRAEALLDGMKISGPTPLHGTVLDAQNDHRLGMSFAVAGLVADGETIIVGSETIETSFPNFESELRRLCR